MSLLSAVSLRRKGVGGVKTGCRQSASAALPLRELEALASALAAVLLAFLHALVAGQVAAVAQLLDHAAGFALLVLGARGFAEHRLQRAGDALADGAGLAR